MRIYINGMALINPISEGVKAVQRVEEIANNPWGELCGFLTNFFAECIETLSIVGYDWL